MDFNEKLREYRTQSGLSQGKLAETLNVSRQAITKWESGNGMPDISNLRPFQVYSMSLWMNCFQKKRLNLDILMKAS